MRQSLWLIICALLNHNLTLYKDWLIYLEAVARAMSSIHLEHKITSYEAKLSNHNNENKLINPQKAIIVMKVLTILK